MSVEGLFEEAAKMLPALLSTAAYAYDIDVLVYGSTPSGVMAAVAAARHGSRSALLSQKAHIGGVCSGGLGQTDIGSCADEAIGGLALEFFHRNAKRYSTLQPRTPWNLEPHVAESVFREMLSESGVALLQPGQVASVKVDDAVLRSITTVDGRVYTSKVFIDASYEGDLMARAGVEYIVGRESRSKYNETNAGSRGTAVEYGPIEFVDPYLPGSTELLPLLKPQGPLPIGEGDHQTQAYNFRLCVTDNASLRVPFTKPLDYDSRQWELLRRFWRGWPTSPSPHKAAQAKAPSAILNAIPSTTGARKFDANNCGYNLVHTDMIGGSWEYPDANYSYREMIWHRHVSYTKGFLWFMSSDHSVPAATRNSFANEWGYCGDEFFATGHFPPQLYVREARRLVGEKVFTQNDVLDHRPLGNHSIGLGCYAFDSHCEERYACTNKTVCTLFDRPYVATQCGIGGNNPGLYQMPLSLLLPKRGEASNLLVSVCNSASHVAFATVRMEPQFMIIGHAAGVVAALAVNSSSAVQDVPASAVSTLLAADGQLLAPRPKPPPALKYGCSAGKMSNGVRRCLLYPPSPHTGNNASCNGDCPALAPREWLANKGHYHSPAHGAVVIRTTQSTELKKSERMSWDLPPWARQAVGPQNGSASTVVYLEKPVENWDAHYWLVTCARNNCTAAT